MTNEDTKSIQENTAAKTDNNTITNTLSESEKKRNEIIKESKQSIDGHSISIKTASEGFSHFANAIAASAENLISYSQEIKNASNVNAKLRDLNKETAQSFAFTTTQVIGASKAYDHLTTVNFNPLTEQTKKMWDVMAAGANTTGKMKDVGASLLSSFLPKDAINGLMSIASQAKNPMAAIRAVVEDQITKFTASADVIGKNRDVYMQLAGASGGLNAAMARSGPNLEKINLLVGEQMDRMNAATDATNLSKEQIVGYYTQLGKIPGALNEQIKTSEKAGGILDGLIARTRLAAATGRDSKDVIEDTTDALRTYNITGNEALTFVARMTELNSKFGMEFSDTQKYMKDTASTFKFIGNEAEGSAKMFNKLMTAFKETGLSAKASTELIGNITGQISKLSIAQKSFLSAQTGGPGGLVGGFQIEKMLREGKIDEVFDKMQGQMKRQFGKIVSIDEAAQSPQAAAQLVRQREMLKQGPLGQFAQTDDQAQRILDAFSKGNKVDVKELSKGDALLNKTLENGKSQQEKNTPIFKQTLGAIEAIRDEGSKVTNKLLEGILTTGAGGKEGKKIADTIRAGQHSATVRAIDTMDRGKSSPREVTGVNVARGIKTVGADIRTIPSVGKVAEEKFGETMSSAAARTKRTGVASAGDKEKHSADYMSIVHKGESQQAERERIGRWTKSQNADMPDQRLGAARTVGNINTDNKNSPIRPEAQERATRVQRSSQMGSIKVEPITVKIIVDKDGRTTYESTQQVNAAMNLPQGGKTP